MYYANCEWYVDMGEHNKPLCERRSLRPAKCSECPVYIRSIEAENAKLREQVTQLQDDWESERDYADQMEAKEKKAVGENTKLRDAMYADAKRHGLQHMDEDELRAWATRQAELIAALRKVAKDMYPSYCYANGGNGETYLTYEQDADIRDRVRELGVLDK